ncbi:MAG: clostripain-related cysteine peptidase, partial [Candidatus Sericytochromatia bacterium]|nr:clostripain-related cysteine peptidase [Candidatus Sericytochromatia bacterium]
MTRLLRLTASLLSVAALVLAGCARAPGGAGWGTPSRAQAPARAAARGETWTLLVHLAADNDLYDFGIGDLQEMEAGLPRDGSLEVLVLFDGVDEGDSAVYRIRRDPDGYNDTIVSEQLAVPSVIPPSGEIDSGDRATVQRFLEWGARQARGQRLMLTFWDHGSGLFRGASAGLLPFGFGYDDSGSHLTTADLSGLCAAVKAVRGRPADIVGFDACLMGHGELAYQIAGLGGLFIASEHLIPGTGWDYEGWFARWERLTSRAPL